MTHEKHTSDSMRCTHLPTIDDCLWIHNIAKWFGHFLACLISGETMYKQSSVEWIILTISRDESMQLSYSYEDICIYSYTGGVKQCKPSVLQSQTCSLVKNTWFYYEHISSCYHHHHPSLVTACSLQCTVHILTVYSLCKHVFISMFPYFRTWKLIWSTIVVKS